VNRPRNVNAPLIRQATLDDVDLLCRLGAATFRETYRAISDPREVDEYADEHFTRDKVLAWFRRPCARTLVATLAGVAVGYAHVRSAKVPACVADRKAVELSRLYLLTSAQGTGLGGALLDAAISEVAALGGATVWLGAYDRNVRALEFYARRGFVPAGTHDFEFGGQIYQDPVLTRPVTEADRATTIIRASQNIPEMP
jgi:ribosomal protein S18 acetylase RimI-like enzyme